MIAIDKNAKCMTPGCDGMQHVRGICQVCYQNAHAIVRRGTSTWEEIQELGLIRPSHGKPRSFILQAIFDRRAKATGAKKNKAAAVRSK